MAFIQYKLYILSPYTKPTPKPHTHTDTHTHTSPVLHLFLFQKPFNTNWMVYCEDSIQSVCV